MRDAEEDERESEGGIGEKEAEGDGRSGADDDDDDDDDEREGVGDEKDECVSLSLDESDVGFAMWGGTIPSRPALMLSASNDCSGRYSVTECMKESSK